MKRLSRYFFEGLLVLVPVVATIYVVIHVFKKIDALFNFSMPGMGFVMTILTITFVGFIASNFLTRGLVRFVDLVFTRLPLVKMIYSSIRDLVGAFVGDKKSFNRPVRVVIDAKAGIEVLGFVTRESLQMLGIEAKVAVYLPQSYNFAGNLLVVPAERVSPLQADPGEVMSFIVSGGVTSSG